MLILIDSALAATIHGNVYDLYLDKQENSIVTINTIPKQTFVAKDGEYSFDVPAGTYELKAEYYKVNELISFTNETITISYEGDYIVDLILFPSFLDEELILNETDVEFDDFEENGFWDKVLFGGFVALLIKAIIVLISILIIIFTARKVYKKIKRQDERLEKNMVEDIIDFIKSKGGRTTQKEIRKNFMTSQAKISLIITEMEHKKLIEKIKKGRGNIIILKK